MARNKNTESEILKKLFKNYLFKHTVSSLAKELKLSRIGVWKILKKMEIEKLIMLKKIGSGITSTFIIELNHNNPLIEKKLALILTEEALKQQRWIQNFKELEKYVNFLIIYGSVLNNSKEANDIDLLGIVTNKNNYKEIDKIINNVQKSQIKRIHIINFSSNELKKELENKNNAFIDAIKNGIILFGQENFIKFMKSLVKNEL